MFALEASHVNDAPLPDVDAEILPYLTTPQYCSSPVANSMTVLADG